MNRVWQCCNVNMRGGYSSGSEQSRVWNWRNTSDVFGFHGVWMFLLTLKVVQLVLSARGPTRRYQTCEWMSKLSTEQSSPSPQIPQTPSSCPSSCFPSCAWSSSSSYLFSDFYIPLWRTFHRRFLPVFPTCQAVSHRTERRAMSSRILHHIIKGTRKNGNIRRNVKKLNQLPQFKLNQLPQLYRTSPGGGCNKRQDQSEDIRYETSQERTTRDMLSSHSKERKHHCMLRQQPAACLDMQESLDEVQRQGKGKARCEALRNHPSWHVWHAHPYQRSAHQSSWQHAASNNMKKHVEVEEKSCNLCTFPVQKKEAVIKSISPLDITHLLLLPLLSPSNCLRHHHRRNPPRLPSHLSPTGL